MVAKRGFKWEIAILSAALTVAVLSVAYYGYQNIGVKKPLEKALLADPDVLSCDIKRASKLVAEVSVSPVTELASLYARLADIVEEKAGPDFELVIKDERNDSLESFYHSIHYYLEEAAVRGNFGEMIESARNTLSDKGLSQFEITVDKKNIYVQMSLGNAYLYEVLDRGVPGFGGEQR